MDCRSFRDNHLAFLDDVLPDDEAAGMRRHLLECGPCAEHDTAIRRGLLLVRNLPPIEPSPDFKERLNARLRETCAREAMRRAAEHLQSAPGAGLFAATAVGLLAASLLATTFIQRPIADVVLPPVVATHPEPRASASVSSALVATVPATLPVWPTALLVDQAANQFRLASWPSR